MAIAACAACGAAAARSGNANERHGDRASVAAFAQNDSVSVETYPIADDCAGPFRIGAAIPKKADGFVVAELREETIDAKGDTCRITVYVYEIGNEGWVKVTPQYDAASGCANGRIGEIFVYSDLFLTGKGIGAMSSIEAFAAAYPDFEIRYADERFMVETPQLRNVRFLLEKECCIGTEIGLFSSGSVNPKISDFKARSCFTAIRIGR